MRRLRSLIACLLLALWLPATLHCSLQQSGLLGEKDSCADQCATDNCDVLENGLFKSTVVAATAPMPTLFVSLCSPIEISLETIIVPSVSPERADGPPEVARMWQFAERAAPLPGAPSLAG